MPGFVGGSIQDRKRAKKGTKKRGRGGRKCAEDKLGGRKCHLSQTKGLQLKDVQEKGRKRVGLKINEKGNTFIQNAWGRKRLKGEMEIPGSR